MEIRNSLEGQSLSRVRPGSWGETIPMHIQHIIKEHKSLKGQKMLALPPLFYPPFIPNMIYLKGSRKRPVDLLENRPFPQSSATETMPNRYTSQKLGKEKYELEQMTDVRLEMSLKRWVDVRGRKGRESSPQTDNCELKPEVRMSTACMI